MVQSGDIVRIRDVPCIVTRRYIGWQLTPVKESCDKYCCDGMSCDDCPALKGLFFGKFALEGLDGTCSSRHYPTLESLEIAIIELLKEGNNEKT